MGTNPHIINGWRAQRGMIPWQVAITMDQSSGCGGSLITSRHVLSAAHCIENVRSVLVVLGAQNVDNREQGRVALKTSRKIVHPDFNGDLLKNDISIIYLPRKVLANRFINPVRLPRKFDDKLDYSGKVGVVSGWGRTNDRNPDPSSTLFYTDLNVVKNKDCVDLFGANTFRDTNVCAMGSRGRAVCLGDSGGALVIKDRDGGFTQIGVLSYGSDEGCGKGYPDVFTRVSSYVGWISAVTKRQKVGSAGASVSNVDQLVKDVLINWAIRNPNI